MHTDKQALREQFKLARVQIPVAQRKHIDAEIAQQVVALPEFKAADMLFAYKSFGAEIETCDIIQAAWDAGKRVALPRCVPGTRHMQWHEVDSFDGLVQSSFGVEEPPEDFAPEVELVPGYAVLVLVPGLTFDARGFRLGYGGGFYDEFFAQVDKLNAAMNSSVADRGLSITSVGLCRQVQLSEHVPHEIHDQTVQIVVTESQVLRVW